MIEFDEEDEELWRCARDGRSAIGGGFATTATSREVEVVVWWWWPAPASLSTTATLAGTMTSSSISPFTLTRHIVADGGVGVGYKGAI